MKVLVTGGTGVLGRELVQRLNGRAEVRVLSRKPAERPGFVQGDLSTGDGLDAALEGVDVVAHLASASDYRHPERDVEQTRRLLAAAAPTRPHIVYISIVGVDKIPFGYYRAKLACEQMIEQSGLPRTTLRTTQFHDLALMLLMIVAKSPVVVLPRGLRGQPVHAGEVADRMADLVLREPAGRVPDMGGPEVLESKPLVRRYLELTNQRRPVIQVPVPGRTLAGFRAGHHLLSDGGVRGTRTFEDYLAAKLGPNGSVSWPYKPTLRR